MRATGDLDLREWNAALREYIPTTKKDLATIVNERTNNVARRALVGTPAADKGKVKAELEQEVATRVKLVRSGKNKGKLRKVGASSRKRFTLANLIVQARRRARGQKGLSGQAMRQASFKFVGARHRSVGWAKLGWVYAIQDLNRVTKRQQRWGDQGIRITPRKKGSAKPAVPGFAPRATIVNNVLMRGMRSASINNYRRAALQKAVNDEARELRRHVKEKMEASSRRFKGRRR